ncbi:Vacuolar membrane amino acid uptake transporter fnx2 like protein [Verticillium longisporum]|uniref:Vacuolar membrane amino acid uptake transporter fnx2 like protein n=1 Tax=Verticillium longisporum TaxID=100787 RepID=A0A8I3ASU6_VERLO|nr:Vacuolar membrane amino acid uptake transporter fnx2 like protein [Verticillium longisporum]
MAAEPSAAPMLDERAPLLLSSSATISVTSDSSYDASDEGASVGPRDEEASVGRDGLAPTPRAAVVRIVAILLLGTFTSNADGSLVLATHPTIASEFNDLEDSSWLFTAFALAGASTQAIYGKLSDIYGRRALLVVAYSLFALGCFIVGIGGSMWEVVLGRVISGSGGSAMNVVAALVITDLVPLRDVAAWQATINLAATIGRSLGGPVGGWLADTIGWRWSFLGQAPIFMFALLLCMAYLPSTTKRTVPPASAADQPAAKPSEPTKGSLSRIDWLGALLLALTILVFLAPIELGGSKIPWSHPLIPGLLASSAVLAGLFALAEARPGADPIFPLALLRQRDIVLSYAVILLQTAAQLGLMFAVPLYFQVTQRASNTVAGAHLFPAVAGNAAGGILAGLLIRRTGRYKRLTVLATICSSAAYVLLVLRWHGHTNLWESLYIVPGGFGQGVAISAVFVSVQAAVDARHKAAAISGLYLCTTVGMIVGLATVSAVVMGTMKAALDARLVAMGLTEAARKHIIAEAASSVGFIERARGRVGEAVVASYIEGLSWSHGHKL